MLTMNFLANALPLNGKTTGDLSKQWNNEFVPAGYTFSIWGVIYLLIIVFLIKGLLQPKNNSELSKTGWLLPVSCLLNGLWIVAWHYEQLPLSIIIIVLMLLSLLFINQRIKNASVLVKATFGLYLGWLCIATIANISAWLTDMKWDGLGFQQWLWATVMMGIGSMIAIFASFKLKNHWISVVVIWALAGISVRHSKENEDIMLGALAAILLLMVSLIIRFAKRNKPKIASS